MIPMIIITTGILHNRSNPDRTEAKGFNVIELVDQSFKVTSPGRVRIRIACLGIIPIVHIIILIPVIEPRSYDEIDAVFPEIAAFADVIDKVLCGLITSTISNQEFQGCCLGDQNSWTGHSS
ncbi:hypothetical protein D3C81_931880 [compost metagenome]